MLERVDVSPARASSTCEIEGSGFLGGLLGHVPSATRRLVGARDRPHPQRTGAVVRLQLLSDNLSR